MKKQITLSVSSPCSEQWDTFSPTASGGFCDACQKNVIDFTQISEKEIFRLFTNKSTGVCGRFKPDQLKTYEEKSAPSISPGWNLLRAGILGVALLLTGQQVSAVGTPPGVVMEIASEQSMEESTNPAKEDGIVLTGVVVDENNVPFPGVNIYVKENETIGTISDENGKFQLSGDIKPGDVVTFSFLGYEPVEYVVKQGLPNVVEIAMSNYHVLMGEVQVDGPYQQNGSQMGQLWKKVKNIF